MKFKILLFACAIFLIQHKIVAQIPATNPNSWQLIFEDNFDNLDLNKWKVANNFDHFGEPQVYTNRNENVSLLNGNLVLTVRKETTQCSEVNDWACKKEFHDYTSGWVETKNTSFKYGYIESRINIPYGWGFWPAFWTYVAEGVTNNSNAAEIDIFEMLGQKASTTMGTNLHMRYCDANSYDYIASLQTCAELPDYGLDVSIPSYAYTYHKYGVEWSPTRIKWYVDDILVRDSPNPGIVDPSRIILNMAIWKFTTSSTPSAASMLVDYVRVYGLKLNLQNQTIAIGNSKDYYASYSITAAGNNSYYNVDGNGSTGGSLTLKAANSIMLEDGFSVKAGAYFSAEIDDFKSNSTKSLTEEDNLSTQSKVNEIQPSLSDNKLSEPNKEPQILPNPNNGLFTLNVTNENIKSIYVYDMLGKVGYQKINSSDQKFEIDITTQPKGIYIVKVIDGDNVKMFKVINQ